MKIRPDTNILYILASAETSHDTYFISPCSPDHSYLRAARQVRAETYSHTLHSSPKKPVVRVLGPSEERELY